MKTTLDQAAMLVADRQCTSCLLQQKAGSFPTEVNTFTDVQLAVTCSSAFYTHDDLHGQDSNTGCDSVDVLQLCAMSPLLLLPDDIDAHVPAGAVYNLHCSGNVPRIEIRELGLCDLLQLSLGDGSDDFLGCSRTLG